MKIQLFSLSSETSPVSAATITILKQPKKSYKYMYRRSAGATQILHGKDADNILLGQAFEDDHNR